MSRRLIRITLCSTVAVLGLTACLLAQYKRETEPFGDADPLRLAPSVPTANPPLTYEPDQRRIPHVIPRTVYVTEMRPLSKQEEQELANYAQLLKSLREAKDDAARQPIADKIKEILRAKFDRDMAEREKELKGVEERVTALRKQHDKRASMRDEIISLNIKTILFNAEGLDLPLNYLTAPVPVPTSDLPSDLYDVPTRTPSARTPIAPTYESQPQSKPSARPEKIDDHLDSPKRAPTESTPSR